MTIINKIEEIKMSCKKSLPNEIQQDEIGKIELTLTVLTIAKSFDLIIIVNLYAFKNKDYDYIIIVLPAEINEQIKKLIQTDELLNAVFEYTGAP